MKITILSTFICLLLFQSCEDRFIEPAVIPDQQLQFPQVANQRLTIPVKVTTCVPCSNKGHAENMFITGSLDIEAVISFQSPREFTARLYYRTLNLTVSGETSGLVYQAPDALQVVQFSEKSSRNTLKNMLTVTTQGMPAALIMKDSYFVHLNKEGRVSIEQVNIGLDCL